MLTPVPNSLQGDALGKLRRPTELRCFAAELRADLDDLVIRAAVPGIVAAVSVSGQLFTSAAGLASAGEATPLGPRSRFQIGCITKILTSLVALHLAESGQVQLEAPISSYLSDLQGFPSASGITIGHLLTHTSGYCGLDISDPGVAYYFSWRKFRDFLAKTPRLFRPGTVFSYEHSEAVILGEIIRRVTGERCGELFSKLIFNPLGILVGAAGKDSSTASECCVADHVYDRGKGTFLRVRTIPYSDFWEASLASHTMAVPDLLRLFEALFASRLPAQSRGTELAAAAVGRILTQIIPVPRMYGGPHSEQLPSSFGFGLARYAGGEFGHNGSTRGQTCAVRYDPVRDVSLVVAINAWQPYVRDSICRLILQRLDAAMGQAPPMLRDHGCDFKARDVLGTYIGGGDTTVVVSAAADDTLACEIRHGRRAPGIRAAITLLQGGRLLVHSDLGHLSCGFFRNPDTGGPCLMMGMTAYRRSELTSPHIT